MTLKAETSEKSVKSLKADLRDLSDESERLLKEANLHETDLLKKHEKLFSKMNSLKDEFEKLKAKSDLSISKLANHEAILKDAVSKALEKQSKAHNQDMKMLSKKLEKSEQALSMVCTFNLYIFIYIK